PPPPPPPPSGEATYRVVFSATWSAATHPDRFPSGPHFSPLIGAVHNSTVEFWALGATASAGIEVMAETGGTGTLSAEINAQSPGGALAVISGSGAGSPGSATIQGFNVKTDYPLVTLVTMIAPSPDWFAGVSGLSLQDGNGQWIDELTVTLYPLDAGSDSGSYYTAPNQDTSPAEAIRSLQGVAPFSSAPVGTFTFTRTDS
ncbi:MAG: elongation factor Ts, partial [Gemmatimonadales bacterium]|nr:elongation factor Ts [Gemmatimonadales bacterium]